MDLLRTERDPGVWHSGGSESDGVGGRVVGFDGRVGWAEVYGRVEEITGRHGKTSPVEDRGNEAGVVVIEHGSVEPANRH